jgi:hypothetical protein
MRGIFFGHQNVTSEECGRDVMDLIGYNDSNATGQGRQAIIRWNFGNTVDGLVGIESVAEESAKKEEQEMDETRSHATRKYGISDSH